MSFASLIRCLTASRSSLTAHLRTNHALERVGACTFLLQHLAAERASCSLFAVSVYACEVSSWQLPFHRSRFLFPALPRTIVKLCPVDACRCMSRRASQRHK